MLPRTIKKDENIYILPKRYLVSSLWLEFKKRMKPRHVITVKKQTMHNATEKPWTLLSEDVDLVIANSISSLSKLLHTSLLFPA